MPRPEKHVLVCVNARPPGHPKGSCMANGAQEIIAELGRHVEDRELYGRIKITRTSCLGPCELGPTVLVYPEGVMYCGVKAADVEEIVTEHLLGNRYVERLKAPPGIWD